MECLQSAVWGGDLQVAGCGGKYGHRIYRKDNLRKLTPAEFERVLHPVFEEDELTLVLVGAVLGGVVGWAQAWWDARGKRVDAESPQGGEPAAATPVEREPEVAVKEETVVPQTLELPDPADAEAATKAEAATEAPAATDTDAAPDVAPPDGFTWGATF